jgi:hypothetical protein
LIAKKIVSFIEKKKDFLKFIFSVIYGHAFVFYHQQQIGSKGAFTCAIFQSNFVCQRVFRIWDK